jgi:hypothetical protein
VCMCIYIYVRVRHHSIFYRYGMLYLSSALVTSSVMQMLREFVRGNYFADIMQVPFVKACKISGVDSCIFSWDGDGQRERDIYICACSSNAGMTRAWPRPVNRWFDKPQSSMGNQVLSIDHTLDLGYLFYCILFVFIYYVSLFFINNISYISIYV